MHTYGDVRCEANSTVTDKFTLEKKSLCYNYELCGLSTVDTVGMTFHILDTDIDSISYSEELIDATDRLSFVNVEPFNIIEEKKDAINGKVIYDDDKYKVSALTVDKDFFGLSELPMLYLMVENNGDYIVDLDFTDEDFTFEEILDSANHYVEINGKAVKCDKMIGATTILGDFVPGSKTIVYIPMKLEEAGIKIEDIETIKREFELKITEGDYLTYLKAVATFMMEYNP